MSTEEHHDVGMLPEALLPVDDNDIAALRDRLAERAGERELLDLAYRDLDSPLGQLLLVSSPVGLIRVAFQTEEPEDVLRDLAQRISPRILRSPRRLDAAAREFEEYFTGDRERFDLPLDHRLSRGFQARVHELLPEIGFGETRSYAQVAAMAGSPRAVRAVGTACAVNPLPLVVPCHRVVRSDGSSGSYRGGPEAKALLLDLESSGARGG